MEHDRTPPAARLADYALALDLVSRMAALIVEAVAIDRVLDLFVELSAPATLAYLPVYEGHPGELRCRPVAGLACDELSRRLASLDGEWAWTASGCGFLLRVHRGGETLGALEVDGLAFPEHKEHYLNLALSLQGVLGLAVSNARNYENLERARQEEQNERESLRTYLDLSEALNRINATVGSTLDFDEIIRRVLGEATEALGADSASLVERREEGWVVTQTYGNVGVAVGDRFRDDQVPTTTRAARERRTIVSNNLAEVVPVLPEQLEGTRASISAPLLVRDELVSVLAVGSARLNAFSEPLVDFASKIATTVSLALENARLFEAKRSVADTLQRALLEMPEHCRGVTFGHRYRAASAGQAEVGGDFYELFALPDGRVALLVGDIAGKGVVAAKTTSLVKDTVRAYAQLPEPPASVLRRTNDVVFRMSAAQVFATLFFGVLDPLSGKLTYCSAGHPPALVRHGDGAVATLLDTSPLLGAFLGVEFRDATTRLSAEDVLVLYTDGVIEARRGGEFFGDERLRRVVAEAPGEPEAVADAVLGAVERFAGGVFSDDLALLCVRRKLDE